MRSRSQTLSSCILRTRNKGSFLDLEEKYGKRTAVIHCPARIGEADSERIKQTAVKIYRALGCSGFARVDMFLAPDGRIVFNEVNTIPGMTQMSRFPKMMLGAEFGFGELVSRMCMDVRPKNSAACYELH